MNEIVLFLLVSAGSVYAMEKKESADKKVPPKLKILKPSQKMTLPQSRDILVLQQHSPFNGCIDEGLAIKEFLALQELHHRGNQ